MNTVPPTSTDGSDRPTLARYVVLAAVCSVAAIAYLSRNYGIAVAEESVRSDLNITEDQLGMVMGTFFISYSLFQIPGGWLGKIWGSRLALTIFAVVSSLATLLMGFATNLSTLIALRLIIGAAQAGLFPSAANTISKWFPVARRAMASGSMASFMSIGGASASAMAGVLLSVLSWRWVFIVFSIPGLLWAVWFYFWFRNRPEEHRSVNEAELTVIHSEKIDATSVATSSVEQATDKTEQVDANAITQDENEPTPWGAMAASPAMWLICAQQFFRAAGFIFYPTWFPKFLKETRGVTQMEAGVLSSLPMLATVAGCLAGGFVIDWLYNRTGSRRISRQLVAVVNLSVCSILIFLAYFIEDATAAVLLISAGSFFAAVAGPAAYTVTMDLAGNHVPLVFSTMNMSGNIAAAMIPMIVPTVVGLTGSWNAILFFFGGIYLAGAICWSFLNPNATLLDPHEH